jgi:hypothetical protein
MAAQCEVEVKEARQKIWAPFFTLDYMEALEVFVEKVIVRWWISRMLRRDSVEVDAEQAAQRQQQRGQVLHGIMHRIQERSGPIKIEALQINLLGAATDVSAVWGALIEAGIVTPQMRQDYLDKAVMDLAQRVEDHAQKIQLATSVQRTRQ